VRTTSRRGAEPPSYGRTLVGPIGLPWWLPIIGLAVIATASAGLRHLALRKGRDLWKGLAVLRSLQGGRVIVFVLVAAILGRDGVAAAAAAGVLMTVTDTIGGLCFAAWAGADRIWSGSRRDALQRARSRIPGSRRAAPAMSVESAGRQDVAERRAVGAAGAGHAAAVQSAGQAGAGRLALAVTTDDPVDDVSGAGAGGEDRRPLYHLPAGPVRPGEADHQLADGGIVHGLHYATAARSASSASKRRS
jgi:hypothetical protein